MIDVKVDISPVWRKFQNMKIKYEKVYFETLGYICTYYIKKVKKHWWNKWKTVMDRNVPARYDVRIYRD